MTPRMENVVTVGTIYLVDEYILKGYVICDTFNDDELDSSPASWVNDICMKHSSKIKNKRMHIIQVGDVFYLLEKIA